MTSNAYRCVQKKIIHNDNESIINFFSKMCHFLAKNIRDARKKEVNKGISENENEKFSNIITFLFCWLIFTMNYEVTFYYIIIVPPIQFGPCVYFVNCADFSYATWLMNEHTIRALSHIFIDIHTPLHQIDWTCYFDYVFQWWRKYSK